MDKKHYYNLNWKSKKAFIFTMDVTVALVVVALFLMAATAFVTKSNKDPYPDLQLVKYGSDVIKVLEYKGYLTSLTPQKISNLLPSYYDMQITGYAPCTPGPIGNTPPEDRFIASGKYYFKSTNNFCYVRYKIWSK